VRQGFNNSAITSEITLSRAQNQSALLHYNNTYTCETEWNFSARIANHRT
jgi:hypothetical protein